ncbi:hypothetical protein [Burkholderia sola]|uniref:hypothetical protein n=1 Tax=Burkholderia sola TaxID=2843302 RepID=UPI003F495C5D
MLLVLLRRGARKRPGNPARFLTRDHPAGTAGRQRAHRVETRQFVVGQDDVDRAEIVVELVGACISSEFAPRDPAIDGGKERGLLTGSFFHGLGSRA